MERNTKSLIDDSYNKLNYEIDKNYLNPEFGNYIQTLEEIVIVCEALPKKLFDDKPWVYTKEERNKIIMDLFKPFNFFDYPYNIDDIYLVTTTGFDWLEPINILFESLSGKEIEYWV